MASDLRVGCLGGGQLGRLTAQAASRLGVSFTVLDPGGLSSPAGQVCGKAIEGSFKDGAKVRELASQVDVLTVEIEHIDASALAEIEAEGRVAVHPSHFTLTTVQDKLLQKRHLASRVLRAAAELAWAGAVQRWELSCGTAVAHHITRSSMRGRKSSTPLPSLPPDAASALGIGSS